MNKERLWSLANHTAIRLGTAAIMGLSTAYFFEVAAPSVTGDIAGGVTAASALINIAALAIEKFDPL